MTMQSDWYSGEEIVTSKHGYRLQRSENIWLGISSNEQEIIILLPFRESPNHNSIFPHWLIPREFQAFK